MERPVPPVAKTLLQAEASVIHPMLVEIDVPTIRSGDPDDLWHGFCQCAEFLEAPLQRFRSMVGLGDVGHNSGEPQQFVGTVANLKTPGSNPTEFAIGPHDAIFDVHT